VPFFRCAPQVGDDVPHPGEPVTERTAMTFVCVAPIEWQDTALRDTLVKRTAGGPKAPAFPG